MNQQPYLGRFVRFAPIASILLAITLPHEGGMAQSERSDPPRSGIGARLRDLFYGETPARQAPPPPRSQGRRYSLDRPAPTAPQYQEPAPQPREQPLAPAPPRNSRPGAGSGNPEVPSNWRRADTPPAPQPERPVTKPVTPPANSPRTHTAPNTASTKRQTETKPATTKDRSNESSAVVSQKPSSTTPSKPAPPRRESIIKQEVATKPATPPSTPSKELETKRDMPPAEEKPMRTETPAPKEEPKVAEQEMKLPASDSPVPPRKEPIPNNPGQSEAPSKPSVNEPKVGTKTAVPGRVKSPYPPFNELDVTGLPSGSLAMDPTTKKVFRIP